MIDVEKRIWEGVDLPSYSGSGHKKKCLYSERDDLLQRHNLLPGIPCADGEALVEETT